MVFNTLVILGIISGIGFGGYKYIMSMAMVSENDQFEDDYTDVATLTRKISEQFSMMLKQDIRERNMTRYDYEQSQRRKAEIRMNLKEAAYGNANAKKAIKAYITGMLLSEDLGFGVNEKTINEIIPFENVEELHSRDKFEILLYIYSNYVREIDDDGNEGKILGKNGLAQIFRDFMCEKDEYGRPTKKLKTTYVKIGEIEEKMYDFTSEMLDEIFNEVYAEQTLSFTDKVAILAQRIFSNYKGFGVIDVLFDTSVDEIDGGISGVSKDGYDIESKNQVFSYQSIWITLFGNKIRLSCLSFGSQEELIRVTQNIYKYGANKVLDRDKGYVVSTMKNGSRITVMRPPFASSYAFFARKFDSTPSVKPEKLIGGFDAHYGNIQIPLTIIQWLIKGERTGGITGAQATGKSTMLKSLISFISPRYSIRVQEISAELNLQYTYPNRNIVSFQETETINSQEGINLAKKTNADITIIGELAEAVQATYVIQTAQVASLQSLFTHHAKTSYDFITAIADNLLDPTYGIYNDKKEAIEKTAEVLNFDIHLANRKGTRYMERITEIIPTKASDYPTEKNKKASHEDDEREYWKRTTDRELFKTVNLVEFHDGNFYMTHMPSKELMDSIVERLSLKEEKDFYNDMKMLEKYIDEYKKSPYYKEAARTA